ncbi:MAG TPA: YidC/Oxa1 family membrane protein insertase [Patescibacteria group bacterium]|nr:YidC/Oxa1 family membrane protein insertase [Patescibacteria group bacterium]
MDFLISIFNVFLYQPLFNALVFLYQFLPGKDFGIAIISLTVVIRIALYPLMLKSIKSQKALSELQPRIQEIQQKYKNDKEQQAKETMALYRKEKINPFGGCFPLLIQLPILIALYRVFWRGMSPEAMSYLYSFVSNPGEINPTFLGLINLAEPNLVLAFLAGICQFFQTKMMMSKNKKPAGAKDQKSQFADVMQKQMLYFFPFFTVFILWKLPSAIGLYWLIIALFSILQQYLVLRPSLKTKQNV